MYEKLKKFIVSNYTKILCILIYKLTLDLIYVTTLSTYFAGGNFVYNMKIYKCIISVIVICIFSIPIYNLINLNSASNVVVTLFNLLYFIPGTVLYAFQGFSNKYFLFFVIYWGVLLFFQYNIKIPIVKEKILKNKIKDYRYIIIFMIFFVGISIFITGMYNNFQLSFNLENIYELREKAQNLEMPIILRYLKNWAAQIIPLGIAIALLKKKRILSIFCIFIQLLLFSFDGMKTSLFILGLVVLSFLVLNKKTYSNILGGLSFVGIFLNLVSVISGRFVLISYFFRRVMFLPNLISNYYYNFFCVNEKLFLRQSVARKLGFSNPYNLDIQYLISDVYFNKIAMSSNNGLIGDAYANFGWLSLFIYPLMMVIVLKLLDFTTKNVDIRIVFVVCVEWFISFTNSSFFTVLLTGGALITMIFFLVIPKDDTINSENKLYLKIELKLKDIYSKIKYIIRRKNENE